MFENITSTQSIADQIKPLIRRADGDRAYAMQVLQTFERCGWHGPAFEEFMKHAGPGRFAVNSDDRLSYEGDDVLTAVIGMLSSYITTVCDEPLPSRQGKTLYTTAEAADYLGLSTATIRKNIYKTQKLVGEMVGHTLVFTKAELDAFASRRQQVGRPAKAVQPSERQE